AIGARRNGERRRPRPDRSGHLRHLLGSAEHSPVPWQFPRSRSMEAGDFGGGPDRSI
ncbi:MAG: hypothetical protein AVDCRST_MAG59-3934, partial [uncultured Thermomicrobiales bacterium]